MDIYLNTIYLFLQNSSYILHILALTPHFSQLKKYTKKTLPSFLHVLIRFCAFQFNQLLLYPIKKINKSIMILLSTILSLLIIIFFAFTLLQGAEINFLFRFSFNSSIYLTTLFIYIFG